MCARRQASRASVHFPSFLSPPLLREGVWSAGGGGVVRSGLVLGRGGGRGGGPVPSGQGGVGGLELYVVPRIFNLEKFRIRDLEMFICCILKIIIREF